MQISQRLLAGLCTVAALSGAATSTAQTQSQDHAGQYAMADIVFGAQLYAAQCVNCHGANGDGVGNVNLRSGPIRRATTDRELQQLITTGIAGTGMPPFTFTQAELMGIVAYVRNMNATDPTKVRLGDAARGRTIVEGQGRLPEVPRHQRRGVRGRPRPERHRRHAGAQHARAPSDRPVVADDADQPARQGGDEGREDGGWPPAERGHLHRAADGRTGAARVARSSPSCASCRSARRRRCRRSRARSAPTNCPTSSRIS